MRSADHVTTICEGLRREIGARGVPDDRITVVQALPKGDRGEVAVETMTETGVDAIVPWAASRCITQWKGERGLKARRLDVGFPEWRHAGLPVEVEAAS